MIEVFPLRMHLSSAHTLFETDYCNIIQQLLVSESSREYSTLRDNLVTSVPRGRRTSLTPLDVFKRLPIEGSSSL